VRDACTRRQGCRGGWKAAKACKGEMSNCGTHACQQSPSAVRTFQQSEKAAANVSAAEHAASVCCRKQQSMTGVSTVSSQCQEHKMLKAHLTRVIYHQVFNVYSENKSRYRQQSGGSSHCEESAQGHLPGVIYHHVFNVYEKKYSSHLEQSEDLSSQQIQQPRQSGGGCEPLQNRAYARCHF